MMSQKIKDLLKHHEKALVDEVEGEVSDMVILNGLVNLFPMTHRGVDKTHRVWTRALRDVVWLGWLSEAKRRRGVYNDRICNAIKQSIIDAFEIGRKYSVERP